MGGFAEYAIQFHYLKASLSQGFQEEARLRQCAVLADGTRTDYLAFGILRAEWLAKRRAEAPDKFANIAP